MPHTMIGDVLVDANIEEAPTYSSEITDKPVEDGSSISDHVGQEPVTLNLECVITGQEGADAEEKYEQLIHLWEEKETFDVVAGLQVYEDMIINEFSPVKDAEVGNGFRADIEMQQVKFVGLETIEIELEPESGAQGEEADPETRTSGTDEVDEDTASEEERSIMHRGVHGPDEDDE